MRGSSCVVGSGVGVRWRPEPRRRRLVPAGSGAMGNPGTATSADAGVGTSSGTAAVVWGVVGPVAWVASWCAEATPVAAIGAGVSQRAMESWTVTPFIGTIVAQSAALVVARQLAGGQETLHGAARGRAQGTSAQARCLLEVLRASRMRRRRNCRGCSWHLASIGTTGLRRCRCSRRCWDA